MNMIADFRTFPVVSPIVAVRAMAGYVEVKWGDGRISPFHEPWLRDNCPCPACVYAVTREQVFQIADVPADLRVESAGLTAQGTLALVWQDGHASQFDPGWLRAHAYDEASRNERNNVRPKKQLWRADLPLQVFPYADIMADDAHLLAWLIAVRDTGLTQVTGMPVAQGTLTAIARRISFIRETNFGVLFDVQSKVEADSNAYTAFNLPLHTDLPTRELQPGLQFLHCLVNDALGGDSTFVDGFAVADYLNREEPELYRILCQTPVEFRNKGRTSDYRFLAPIIALDASGALAEVRMANFLRGPYDLPPEQMLPYYSAYRRFIELTRDPRFRFTRRLEAGQMWCFDNRRVLHARDAFDPASGARHLQGCYVDRDELLSRILVLQR
ncbi:gamma-butyrobetaine dioxygenase [Pseudomonas sp. Pseusp122]|uniref:gamma-butyrobetaine dioxygenase n=1 Tax=unclassified Pseudomonas TaxID=196821 RepID=UPI0039A726F5